MNSSLTSIDASWKRWTNGNLKTPPFCRQMPSGRLQSFRKQPPRSRVWMARFPGMTFGRQRATADHRFAIEHPLMDVSRFRSEMLVGKAVTFFGSTGSGGQQRPSSTKSRQTPKNNAERKKR